MAIIVPAILEDTVEAFSKSYKKVTDLTGVGRIHIDFCDGKFVSRTSLPVRNLPQLDARLHLEAHLMHQEPRDFDRLQDMGFSTIIIHAEAYQNPESLREAVQNITLLGLKAGVALNPETTVEQFMLLDVVIGHITTLGVHPGHQGNPFIPDVLDKIKALKTEFPDAILEVDGGMNKQTAAQAVSHGVDLLVAGSDLLRADDIQAEFNQLTANAEGIQL